MPLKPSEVPANISTEYHHPQPLEGLEYRYTIPELYDQQAKKNPNYPLFVFSDGGKREFITYASVNSAIDRAARYIIAGFDSPQNAPEDGAQQQTVAILARADSATYVSTTIGVSRAGCIAFLISTRNGAAGVADMLKRTGASQLLVSSDSAMRDLARDALSGLPEAQIAVRDMPVFEDLFPTGPVSENSPFEREVKFPKPQDMKTPMVILHSSGSTSFPKTIPWTHKMLALSARSPMTCELETARSIIGCHSTPMFHAMGAFMMASAPICGYIIACFKPASPPTFPTPDGVWQGIVECKCDFAWTVPSLVEEWGRDPAKVEVLKKMSGLFFGGAPLKREVGDALAAQGVNLFTAYGLTETGIVSHFVRPNPGMDWEYYRPRPDLKTKYRPHGDNKYELVVLSPPEAQLPAVNTQINGQEAYATNDLVEPHPTKPNLWRVYGRADEQIMLSNGEKASTNPLPIEAVVDGDPHIKCSVMFGRGKFQNGILVQPSEEFQFDPSDVKALEEFRNAIWPSVERANANAPQHSRVFKEMILVTSPSKPLQLNTKGYPRRSTVLSDYNQEIEDLYQQIEDSSQGDLHAPSVWDETSALSFLRGVMEQTLRHTIGDDDDIFRNGCDSLQATWIRNTIHRAVRETDAKAATRVPANLVFQAPTISSLASAILKLIHSSGAEESHSHSPQDLLKFVEKYSANFPARPANLVERPASAKEVVLITGTTGGFGCDALEHLLRDESVERVYAFNRKGSKALERQHAQFLARGLDESLLNTPKFRMVEAALHEPGFGVEASLLDEVRRSVTHIMHNAWTVNFNLSVVSFERDIQGARNLVDLAISSPYKNAPSIIFVSSIGVFSNYEGPTPAPEVALEDPAVPFGTGYSEGKWITEHVLQNATKERGVHTIAMRLGQVTGNKVGYWNEKEWFPLLVKSAKFQKCLPDIAGGVAWIPGYEGAKAFTELRRSPDAFAHLVHPRPVPWHTIIKPLAEELGVPLVSYDVWLSALQKSVSGGDTTEVDLMKANPALRLLSFYANANSTPAPDHEPLGLVYLSTEKSTAVSAALAGLPQLDADRAKGWLAAWKSAGFL
ncbi:acetyl-CoA synthetase-like protein [Trametes gibbosa]|nr:acetyl-CoA synthetase-like protein [Trametes gibbosa]KAI0828155.1 acetyl-CoA synthetase-like protein [Trametes gibbosa]